MSIMRINPQWFLDERTIEMIEMYAFYRPHPYTAFPGPFSEQPFVWVEAKFIIDEHMEPVKDA